MKILPVFAYSQFSTLKTISGDPKGIVSHKFTQYYKVYVYFNLYIYISRDFSLPLAVWAAISFLGHPYIESTTVLSDIISYLINLHSQ